MTRNIRNAATIATETADIFAADPMNIQQSWDETEQRMMDDYEEENWRMDALEELGRARWAGDWDYYSDLYKDLWGFRPTHW